MEIWRANYRSKKRQQMIHVKKVEEKLATKDECKENLLEDIEVRQTNYIVVGPVSHPLNIASGQHKIGAVLYYYKWAFK